MKLLRATIVGLLLSCCVPIAVGQTVVVVPDVPGTPATTFFNCHCNETECYKEHVHPGAGCQPDRRWTEHPSGDLDFKGNRWHVAYDCAMTLCRSSGAKNCTQIRLPSPYYLAIASGSDPSTAINQTTLTATTITDSTTKSNEESKGHSKGVTASLRGGAQIPLVATAEASVGGTFEGSASEQHSTSTVDATNEQSQTSVGVHTNRRLVWRSSKDRWRAETEAVKACLYQDLGQCRVQAVVSEKGVKCPTPDPLSTAIERGESDSFTTFRQAGYPVSLTILHRSVRRGNINFIRSVAEGVDIDQRDADGQTALWEVDSYRPDIFDALLRIYGTDPFREALDSSRTARRGRFDDPTEPSRWWLSFPRTLLSHAIHSGGWQDIRTLLELGASPLGISPISRPFNAVIEGRDQDLFERYTKYLLTFGEEGLRSNIDVLDELGNSALHVAAGVGNVKAGRWLIKYGARIDLKNKFDRTPLHLAAAGMHVDFVTLLLTASETPSDLCAAVDKDGLQPIHMPLFLGRTPQFGTSWGGLTATSDRAGYSFGTWGRMAGELTWEDGEAKWSGYPRALSETMVVLGEQTQRVTPLKKGSARALFTEISGFPRPVVANVLDAAVSLGLLEDADRLMRDFALRNWRFGIEGMLEDGLFLTPVRVPRYCLDLTFGLCGATELVVDFLAKWHGNGVLSPQDLDDLFVLYLSRLVRDHWNGGDVPLRDGRGRYSFLAHVKLKKRRDVVGWDYVFDVYEWPYDEGDRVRGDRVLSVRIEADRGERPPTFGGTEVYLESSSVEDAWRTLLSKMGLLRGPKSDGAPWRRVLGGECDVEIEVFEGGSTLIREFQTSSAGRICDPLSSYPDKLEVGIQRIEGREVLLATGGCDDCYADDS